MQRESVISRTELERVQNLRDEVFNKGCIPRWVGLGGSVVFAVLAIIVIPYLYTPVKWCVSSLPNKCPLCTPQSSDVPETYQAVAQLICSSPDASHTCVSCTPPMEQGIMYALVWWPRIILRHHHVASLS